MMDHHYCPFCGDEDPFCGCPDDPHTTDRMHCPHCGGQWRRQYGSTSTTCLHRACGKDGSTVAQPARYAPSLPPRQAEILDAAAAGGLRCVTTAAVESWTLRGDVVTSHAAVLRQFRYIEPGIPVRDGNVPGLLTASGRLLLENLRTDDQGHGSALEDEPETDGGWTS